MGRRGWCAAFLVAIPMLSGCATSAVAEPSLTPRLEQEIPSEEREAWRKVIRWPEECEDAFRTTVGTGRSGIVFHDLGGGYQLVQIACAPGAYQGYYVFAGIHRSNEGLRSTLLSFPLFQSKDGLYVERAEDIEVWGTVDFDRRSRKLTVLNRFRGTGDCGTYVVYGFPGGFPVVEQARVKQQCDGQGGEQPQSWPPVTLSR